MLADGVWQKLIDRFGADGFERVEDLGDPFVRVPADRLRDVVAWLRDDPEMGFEALILVSGVDRGDAIDVVYHLRSYGAAENLVLKVGTERDGGSVPSLVDLHPAADWHERETFDLMGVRFEGHPNLRRILLPEDWVGHPLRKDYEAPDEYHGIDNH